jgi:hypothetical protein
MLGSLTTPGRAATRADAADRVAFRLGNAVGTRDKSAFAAQWPACTLPCRRFAVPLTGADARLGASVGRYTFTAEDFHLLLLAGLPAHYQIRLIGSAGWIGCLWAPGPAITLISRIPYDGSRRHRAAGRRSRSRPRPK